MMSNPAESGLEYRPQRSHEKKAVGKGRKWLWYLIIKMLFNWSARANCNTIKDLLTVINAYYSKGVGVK